MALLPESQQSPEGLEENLRSPQLQQAVDALAGALQSENFHTVMSNLGLDPAPGMGQLMRGDAVGAFLAAAVARGQQRQSEEASGRDESKEESKNNSSGDGKDSDDMDQYYS